jgi:threonine 3-dehydrogenase
MKALVKTSPEKGLWLKDVDLPTVENNDLLIKVSKTSICGTDLHIYDWDKWAQKTIKVPTVLGHEFCGEVVEIGKSVQGFTLGDRIAGEGHITCGHCRNCRTDKRHLCNHISGVGVTRDGAFAEYVSIPAINAFLLPDNISDDVASILDPLGNAIHTTLAFDLAGEDVLITGAGPIGIMAAAVAKHVGARRVIISDLNDYRLELAKKMGATHTVNVSKTPLEEYVKSIGMLEGVDVGLEMSGNPKALQSILNLIRPGSSIALLGILPDNAAIDWQKVIFKGLTLQGIYGRKMFETWYKMSGMLSDDLDVLPILTHSYSFEDFEEGFKAMSSGKCGKVILDWRNPK